MSVPTWRLLVGIGGSGGRCRVGIGRYTSISGFRLSVPLSATREAKWQAGLQRDLRVMQVSFQRKGVNELALKVIMYTIDPTGTTHPSPGLIEADKWMSGATSVFSQRIYFINSRFYQNIFANFEWLWFHHPHQNVKSSNQKTGWKIIFRSYIEILTDKVSITIRSWVTFN